jgi:hypothetical protein
VYVEESGVLEVLGKGSRGWNIRALSIFTTKGICWMEGRKCFPSGFLGIVDGW